MTRKTKKIETMDIGLFNSAAPKKQQKILLNKKNIRKTIEEDKNKDLSKEKVTLKKIKKQPPTTLDYNHLVEKTKHVLKQTSKMKNDTSKDKVSVGFRQPDMKIQKSEHVERKIKSRTGMKSAIAQPYEDKNLSVIKKEKKQSDLEVTNELTNSNNNTSSYRDTVMKLNKAYLINQASNDSKSHKKKPTKLKELDKRAAVVVKNLPASLILNYNQALVKHFSKYGEVKWVSIADMNVADFPNQKFRATVFFDSTEASTEALKENNSLFEGNLISVEQHKLRIKRKANADLDKNKGLLPKKKKKRKAVNENSDVTMT
ncbi:uncharacterized protein LOC126964553 [Leptidea sinapis]|uniref:uncharacterized protein LOC126964553 n=1 Tax=Leptidea sinapis TaxID=189913 RepID=UPI002138C7FF|nr:uncharacterized protein LOC126964553 [Leptidea sinapis]